jgi:imidazolonepropionase-like amidohydrolase
VIDNGGILIKGKKILKVEKKIKPPKDAEIIDFTDFIVIPGLIDAHSSVGFHEEDFKVQTEPKSWSPFYPSGFRMTPPGTTAPTPKAEARFQAAQAVFYGDPSFKKFLAEGITLTKIAIPFHDLVGGSSVCVKLSANSPSDFIVKNPAGAEFSFVVKENVMKRYGDLKKLFLDTLDYRKKFEKYKKDLKKFRSKNKESSKDAPKEPQEPRKDENKEQILQILDRKIPMMIHASRENEILAALKIKEEFRVHLIIVGGQETYKMGEELALKRIPVIAGPESVLKKKGKEISYISELLKKNVQVAFSSRSSASAAFLPFQMIYAIQHGLSKLDALNILTTNGAQILGIAQRVGSISADKDADFVVLSADPFELSTKVQEVYIGGKRVFSAD